MTEALATGTNAFALILAISGIQPPISQLIAPRRLVKTRTGQGTRHIAGLLVPFAMTVMREMVTCVFARCQCMRAQQLSTSPLLVARGHATIMVQVVGWARHAVMEEREMDIIACAMHPCTMVPVQATVKRDASRRRVPMMEAAAGMRLSVEPVQRAAMETREMVTRVFAMLLGTTAGRR